MVHRSYRIGGVRFGVRTTSERFGEWLDHTLGAYRQSRRSAPLYSVVAGGDGDGEPGLGATRPRKKLHVMYRGTQQTVRTRSLATLGRALLAEVDTFTSGKRKDAVYLNAALLASDGTTALVPSAIATFLGRSHRRVERAGLALPVSSYAAVDPASGLVVPIQPGMEVPADALDRLSDLAPAGEEEDRFVLEAPRTVGVVVTLAPEEGPPLQPISRALALHRTAGLVLNLPRVKGRGVLGLARLTEGARCYALGAWDSAGMLGALSEALADGGDPGPYADERTEDT